jgi:translation initiation factor 2 alpha subunit (eIF-2alpha)
MGRYFAKEGPLRDGAYLALEEVPEYFAMLDSGEFDSCWVAIVTDTLAQTQAHGVPVRLKDIAKVLTVVRNEYRRRRIK